MTEFYGPRNLTILVVEDNPFNLDLLKMILEKEGHTMRVAIDGIEALEVLDSDVDVILMDVQMPRMDGIQTTKLIRLCETGHIEETDNYYEILVRLQKKIKDRHVPIIAITTLAKTENQGRCLDVGMDDYITKPLDQEKLSSVLARLTGKQPQRPPIKLTANRHSPDYSFLLPADRNKVIAHLQNTYGLDIKTITHMLTILKATLCEEIGKAEDYLTTCHFSELSKVAHTIKGALKNAGISEWAEIAQTIEKQNLPETKENKAELTTLLQNLKAGLAALME